MSEYKKIILKNSPVAGAVPLEQFLDHGELALNYADNKIYYKTLNGSIVVHETPNIDTYQSQNSIVRRNLDGSGIFNGVISESTDSDIYSIYAKHDSAVTAKIINTGVCTAAEISSNNGVGAEILSTSGVGAQIRSASGTGALILSTSGVGAQISSTSGVGAQISSTSGVGAQISSTGTTEDSTGLYVSADDGVALQTVSQENLGAEISSTNDTGAEIYTLNGDYHLILGRADSAQQLIGISRPNASVDWLKNNDRIGSLRTTSTISANCNWTLPDRSGTILLDSSIRSGKTIYVDAGVGTDTRNGFTTYSYTPFATISAAVAASSPGDLIYVRAGTYNITLSINLNDEGSLYFEPGAIVSVATGVTAFSFNQATNNFPTANSIRIQGHADFVLTGSAGILTMPTSTNTASPPIVAFECNSITGPSSASGTLFNIVNGVLSVDAKTITMTNTFTTSNATVFNITGTGDVTTRIPFVYCGVFVNGAGAANAGVAQINADVWTLITYNATAGMNLKLVTTSFRIVNYNHVGVGAAFSWTENTKFESHIFRGITWTSLAGQPHIAFASTAASTTNKRVLLYQTNILRAAATNSLSSSLPIDVYTYGSFATAPANSNVTFKVGAFTVDASA
jgi:hypothetical protein